MWITIIDGLKLQVWMQISSFEDNKYTLFIMKDDEKIKYLSQKVEKVWSSAVSRIKHSGWVNPIYCSHGTEVKEKVGKLLCKETEGSTETHVKVQSMSVVHPFLPVVLETRRYVEGRDCKVAAYSSGRTHLKWKQDTGKMYK